MIKKSRKTKYPTKQISSQTNNQPNKYSEKKKKLQTNEYSTNIFYPDRKPKNIHWLHRVLYTWFLILFFRLILPIWRLSSENASVVFERTLSLRGNYKENWTIRSFSFFFISDIKFCRSYIEEKKMPEKLHRSVHLKNNNV